VHLVNSFQFTVAAPFARVAPQFAPEAERSWGDPRWDPVFVYPQPGKDVEGAVFRVKHGPHESLWVNTVFDVAAGHMQYVSVIDGVMVTVVDVRAHAVRADRTEVNVTYTRTALDAVHNADVTAMATHDRDNGPVWRRSVETGLGLPHAER
jgi:hypothetical protein